MVYIEELMVLPCFKNLTTGQEDVQEEFQEAIPVSNVWH